ncbi:hypothetical protein FACS189473_4570 [Spirochaetia bacterium]|nr:hypothetical protein FACS189473_4570 [Spirochaetia bacterium]
MHNDYTLFNRTYPNGKKVVFYYAYDEQDNRRGPWTTKCQSITAARNYCNRLIKTDKLIPKRSHLLTFGEFAEGFWERGSDYLDNQGSRGDITQSYIDNCKTMTIHQILPFFGKTPIEKISKKDINSWLLGFKNREVTVNGKTEKKAYKNTYANVVLGTLNTMMAWALEQEIIKVNPCATVKRLRNDRKKIEIITLEEVQNLFPKNWKPIWDNKEIAFIANKLACLTGMRIGEIMALRGEYVFDDYIHVCGSYGDYGYGPTKTKETRYIPLIPEMIGHLKKLANQNGNGYIFSLDGGAKPAGRKYVYEEYHRALKRIGMDQHEIKRRGLSMHSWRHFLNTELQMQGMTVKQVQAVTGHKSEEMTDNYSHFDARKLSDVMEAQKIISGAKKPGKAPQKSASETAAKSAGTNEKAAGKAEKRAAVLPFPAQENARKRKRA